MLTRSRYACSSLLLLAATVLLGCSPAAEDEWPGWRGPNGMGTVDAPTRLPVRWTTESDNVRWRTAVPGRGNASPVVGGNQVFLTSAYGDTEQSDDKGQPLMIRAVSGIDIETGDLRWTTPVVTTRAERKHKLTTFAVPTPVVHDGDVFAYFGSHLARIDADGAVIWNHEIDPNYVYFGRYGAASSPIIADGIVVVFQDKEYAETEDAGWLAAFDADDGREVWRKTWTHTCCAYSTPIVLRDEEGPYIVIAQSGVLVAHDVADGEQLWAIEYPILQMVTSPVIEDDVMCVSGGGDHVRASVCWQYAGNDRAALPVELWQGKRNPSPSASPVLYGGILYTVTDQGILSAWDARTGRRHWRERLVRGSYRASLLAGDGRVYVHDTHGRTSVVSAAPTYTLLAQNELGPSTNASLGVGDGCLLVRTLEHVVCVEPEVDSGIDSELESGSESAPDA